MGTGRKHNLATKKQMSEETVARAMFPALLETMPVGKDSTQALSLPAKADLKHGLTQGWGTQRRMHHHHHLQFCPGHAQHTPTVLATELRLPGDPFSATPLPSLASPDTHVPPQNSIEVMEPAGPEGSASSSSTGMPIETTRTGSG